jgi:hypothetical protein
MTFSQTLPAQTLSAQTGLRNVWGRAIRKSRPIFAQICAFSSIPAEIIAYIAPTWHL